MVAESRWWAQQNVRRYLRLRGDYARFLHRRKARGQLHVKVYTNLTSVDNGREGRQKCQCGVCEGTGDDPDLQTVGVLAAQPSVNLSP